MLKDLRTFKKKKKKEQRGFRTTDYSYIVVGKVY